MPMSIIRADELRCLKGVGSVLIKKVWGLLENQWHSVTSGSQAALSEMCFLQGHWDAF